MSTNIELLRERIEDDYEDFKDEMLGMSKEDIFINARDISAVEDVLFYLSTHDWLNEDEAAYLLSMECPLAALAAAWEDYQDDETVDFRKALDSLLGSDDSDPNDELDRELDDDDWGLDSE